MDCASRSSVTPRRRWGLFLAAAGGCIYLLATLLLSLSGCTVTQKNYSALSFFFDGVPDPNAPKLPAGSNDEGNETVAGNGGRLNRVFIHKPYDEGRCDACHGAAKEFTDFTKMGSDVCLKCRQKELNKFPVMHGPVAAAECLLCHAPHESTYPKLLKEPSPQVCIQCHLPELLPQKPPEHQSEAVSCLDCHFGHGGPKHGLLRPVSTTAASTQPATTQTTAALAHPTREASHD